MVTCEVLRKSLDQFESVVFCAENYQTIEGLNKIVEYGEQALRLIPPEENPEISAYTAYHIRNAYWERARYYSHRGHFLHSKDPENPKQGITDYNRLLEILSMTDKSTNNTMFLWEVFEGRCECYMKIGDTGAALNEANLLVKNFSESKNNAYSEVKAYLFRSKYVLSLGLLDLASKDIGVVLEKASNEQEISEALRIQKRISEKKGE